MTNSILYEDLLKIIPKEKILIDEPMKLHTTFKIGGKADFFIKPTEESEVQDIIKFAKKEKVKLTVIGNGSNVLVLDSGIRRYSFKT